MSQSEGRGDANPRIYGPAFPPVALFEEAESYTALKLSSGMTKVELATVLIMAYTFTARAEDATPEEVKVAADCSAFLAEETLKAAAKRGAVAEARDDRSAQLPAGTLPAASPPAPPLLDQAGALDKLVDVMQFLCDTHQLDAFNAWILAHQGGDVYDPAEVDELVKNVSLAPQFKREE